ncbi:hypothetical protein ABE356_000219 [Escherichia coli]|nr:hypothetical protein [Escherichia coli]
MRMISFLALSFLRVLMLGLIGLMGALGFLMLCPFPSFWRELTERGSGYAKDKA